MFSRPAQYLQGTNQDLLRGTVEILDPHAVAAALRWWNNGGEPYPRPVSVHLDLTFRCTARCNHCSQWTWAEHPEMTAAQIDVVIQTLRRWHVRTLTIGGGNPLLHEHLAHLLHSAGEAGIAIGIITEGGVPLSQKVSESISRHVRWMRFSIDGPAAHIHDRIRNSAGLFAQTTRTIRDLRTLTPQTAVGINCVIQRRNVEHLEAMLPLAADLDVDVLLFKLPHGEDPVGRYLPTPDDWARVIAWAQAQPDGRSPATNLRQLASLIGRKLDLADIVAGRPVRTYYTTRNVGCYVPLFFLVVDARGDVYPCDYLQADTRPMSNHYRQMRADFVAGNIFVDGDRVLDRMGELLRARVHELPGRRFAECGSCTRFFQFNTALSVADSAVGNPGVTSTRQSTNHGDTRPFF
jgi:MoaA/NifB/PqqE/SkfB family radical SAM enzyme